MRCEGPTAIADAVDTRVTCSGAASVRVDAGTSIVAPAAPQHHTVPSTRSAQ